MADRLLVPVPHEHTHAPRSILREMAVRGSTGKRLVTRSIPDWRSYWYSACYSVRVSQAGCNGQVTSPPELRIIGLETRIIGESDNTNYPKVFIADNGSLGVIIGQINLR